MEVVSYGADGLSTWAQHSDNGGPFAKRALDESQSGRSGTAVSLEGWHTIPDLQPATQAHGLRQDQGLGVGGIERV